MFGKFSTIYILVTLFLISSVTAQNDKIFNTIGVGAFSFGFTAPTYVNRIEVENGSNGKDSLVYFYDSQGGFGYLSVNYNLRYTLWQPNDNFSIGADINPSLGMVILSSNSEGFGVLFSLPLFISANFGEGSTYEGTQNRGGYAGLGVQYHKLFGLGDGNYTNPNTNESLNPISNWVEIYTSGGYRWWSKMDRLKEISFKYGFGFNSSDIPEVDVYNKKISNPFSFSLTYGWFINY